MKGVLEVDGDNGRTTVRMCLMSLNWTLNNNQHSKFYVIYILPQLKRLEGKEEAASSFENALSGKKVPMNPGGGLAGNQQPFFIVLQPEDE